MVQRRLSILSESVVGSILTWRNKLFKYSYIFLVSRQNAALGCIIEIQREIVNNYAIGPLSSG